MTHMYIPKNQKSSVHIVLKLKEICPGTRFWIKNWGFKATILLVKGSGEKNTMRKLLILIVLTSLFSCGKDKEEEKEKLPKAFDQVIAANKYCYCEPVIDKFKLKGEVIYILHFLGNYFCENFPIYYDAEGHKINSPVGPDQPVFIKRMWDCKP